MTNDRLINMIVSVLPVFYRYWYGTLVACRERGDRTTHFLAEKKKRGNGKINGMNTWST